MGFLPLSARVARYITAAIADGLTDLQTRLQRFSLRGKKYRATLRDGGRGDHMT
jgi:hypothetical protein